MIYIAESKTTVKQTCACPENATAVYDIIRQNKYPKNMMVACYKT
jgi:hypothetical protein